MCRSIPALGQFLYLSLLSCLLSQLQFEPLGNWQPLGVNEKMKGIVTIIALVGFLVGTFEIGKGQ